MSLGSSKFMDLIVLVESSPDIDTLRDESSDGDTVLDEELEAFMAEPDTLLDVVEDNFPDVFPDTLPDDTLPDDAVPGARRGTPDSKQPPSPMMKPLTFSATLCSLHTETNIQETGLVRLIAQDPESSLPTEVEVQSVSAVAAMRVRSRSRSPVKQDSSEEDDLFPQYQLNRISEAADYVDDPVEVPKQHYEHKGLTPAQLAWSTSMSSGVKLCRLDGLSSLTWGASAALASFCWGTQVVDTRIEVLESLPRDLQAKASMLLQTAQRAGIQLMSPGPIKTHVQQTVEHIRSQLRSRAAYFYVGITEAPYERYIEHREGRTQVRKMFLWTFPDSRVSGNAEVAVLRCVQESLPESMYCLNKSKGGERRSRSCPHFLYVVWRV